jgi:hypothetical protein
MRTEIYNSKNEATTEVWRKRLPPGCLILPQIDAQRHPKNSKWGWFSGFHRAGSSRARLKWPQYLSSAQEGAIEESRWRVKTVPANEWV